MTGKPRHKLIESLGYLDQLEKEFPDPIAHFKEVASKITDEENNTKCIQIQSLNL